METILSNIYFFTLKACVLFGFLFFIRNKKYGYLHTLPFFILFIYIIEKYGEYLINNHKQNVWLYNYSSVLEICYYIWVVSKMYVNKKYFKIAAIINVLIIIISLVNIIFFQGKQGFHTITFGLGSILVILSCIYYYYQLFIFPSTTALYKQMEFWVVTAIMFDFTCGFLIFCLNNIYYNKISEKIWPIIIDFKDTISITFYLLFIIAFICKIKKF